MDRQPKDFSASASIVGGASLIAATLLFSAVFAYLARFFGYPEVLDLPAAEVLPRLLALGPAGRAVWLLYGLIPLLLVPAAYGVLAATCRGAPLASRAALLLAVLSAVSMMAGLLRWPSLHWQLALAWADASPLAQESISATFAAANRWLGNFVGEFLGELFLNAFFLAASWALARAGDRPRPWLLVAGSAASLLGWVAMLRNAVGGLEPVAALNNIVLPVWMLVLGVVLLRQGLGAARRSARPMLSALHSQP